MTPEKAMEVAERAVDSYECEDAIFDGIRAAAAVIKAAVDAEVRELREALRVLRDLPIVENDNPDTLRLDGVAHTGPAVDYFFRIVRKIKQVARQALS